MHRIIADRRAYVLLRVYRIAAALGAPERVIKSIHRSYVRAVRHANDLYWSQWAAAHGDTNYAARRLVHRAASRGPADERDGMDGAQSRR